MWSSWRLSGKKHTNFDCIRNGAEMNLRSGATGGGGGTAHSDFKDTIHWNLWNEKQNKEH